MNSTGHSWIQRNIRPVVVLACLGAFVGGTLGIPYLIRGTNLSELELQIIWSVFSLYVLSRGGEKMVEIRSQKNSG